MFFWNSCFFDDPADVGNLISGSSAFSKTSLNIWKYTVHLLLKPGLENFEHYFTSMWDECNCVVDILWHFPPLGLEWKLTFSSPVATAEFSKFADILGDCSHEIKRCLLLGRKVMTNLDSIFKSRDITLPTKFHLVKAMVFPVVMYGCESWTIRKLSTEELMLLNCGVGEDSWESLGLQGDPTSPS